MRNIDWGNLRLALYAIVGGVVSALGAVSIIAEDQVDSITQATTAVLGAVLAIVAAANVHKRGSAGTAYVEIEPRVVAPAGDVTLPVYDTPSSTPDEYVGQHRLDG